MRSVFVVVFVMVQYTMEQRVFIVRSYFETHSFAEVQQLFRVQFPDRNPPNKMNIWRNVKKYLDHGRSLNRNLKNSGRKRTGRSQDNIDAVQEELINNPDDVTCRINNLGLPSVTFNRIVRIDLTWHPYKIQRRHQLLAADYQRRRQFSEWFLQKIGLLNFFRIWWLETRLGFGWTGEWAVKMFANIHQKETIRDLPMKLVRAS